MSRPREVDYADGHCSVCGGTHYGTGWYCPLSPAQVQDIRDYERRTAPGESKMIKPTVGRVVWVRNRPGVISDGQPEVGLVAYVWSERLVNVGGFDRNGLPFAFTSLPLFQEGDPAPVVGSPYAEWMPYQKAVAAGEIPPVQHA